MDRPFKIQTRGVRKAFGHHKVLAGIDLDVRAGESLVIMGISGSGKSVLLKCILGLIEADAGSIKIDGQETTGLGAKDLDTLMRKVGVLFQASALFDSLPVWENVAFTLLHAHGLDRVSAKKIAIEKLAVVELEPDIADLRPAELSGGMQKRVALARAIVADPEILFLDDPVAGLDPILTGAIDKVITKCVRDLGTTTVSITHDIQTAQRISDRVAMIHDGRVIWTGDVSAIDTSGNPYVDQYIHGRASGPIQMEILAS